MKNTLFTIIKIFLVLIIGGAIGIAGTYFGMLWIAHDFSPHFLDIDTCIDEGGVWNDTKEVCEEKSIPQEIEKKDETSTTEEIKNTEQEDTTNTDTSKMIIKVADKTVGCINSATELCLLIQKSGSKSWEILDSSIENFQYQSGFEYTLEVKENKTQGNTFTLVKIIEKKNTQPHTDLGTLCKAGYGNWVEETEECEFINPEYCTEILQGTFSECESYCRNDPDAEVCSQQCVPVCNLKK